MVYPLASDDRQVAALHIACHARSSDIPLSLADFWQQTKGLSLTPDVASLRSSDGLVGTRYGGMVLLLLLLLSIAAGGCLSVAC